MHFAYVPLSPAFSTACVAFAVPASEHACSSSIVLAVSNSFAEHEIRVTIRTLLMVNTRGMHAQGSVNTNTVTPETSAKHAKQHANIGGSNAVRDGVNTKESAKSTKRKRVQQQTAHQEDAMTAAGSVKKPETKKKMQQNTTFSPPDWWPEALAKIEDMRSDGNIASNAAVDYQGAEASMHALPNERELSPKEQRFHVLASAMLSSQTQDAVTHACVARLRASLPGGLTPDGLLSVQQDYLGRELIKPVGFWARKANYLQRTAQILKDQYDGDIPGTLEGLLGLVRLGITEDMEDFASILSLFKPN